MKAPILSEIHDVAGGKILEIILNRPEAHNAVNGEAADVLVDLWRRFRDDDSLSVAIVRGSGEKAFCAGADLKALSSLAPGSEAPGAGDGPMGGTRIVQTKPVITMSHGFTYAGGLEIFCHGHIRLAEPSATFSVACRRWGVPLVDGGTVYLPRLLGWGPALPLIITGQRIDARRAYEIGLVWELAPPGRGRDRAFSIAEQICQLPQDCLRADLASAMRGSHLPTEEALALESENLVPVMSSESTLEGVQSFIAGRRFWFE